MPRTTDPKITAVALEAESLLEDVRSLSDPASDDDAEACENRRAAGRAIDALADALARYARARGVRSPRKSAAAWIREHVEKDETLDGRPLREVLGDAARSALPRVASAIPPSERAAGVEEMADHLGLTVGRLRELLRTRDGRRGLWWPLHVGDGCFRWPGGLVKDAAMQAARAAMLEEPHHPVELPPDHAR